MARVLGSTCALVVLLLAVAVAASISNFMGGLKASDVHHAAARIAARASGSYQSPVVPLSGKDDVLALLCGSSTVSERECRDVLRGGAATPPEILKAVGRSATKALAAAVRTAPLLEALHPGLPPNVYAFAKYAHAKIGGGVAAMTSDDAALLEAVDQLRRRGEHLPFAGRAKTTADSYPYFGFLPMALGNALVGGATFTTKTECFRNVSMSAAWTNASQTSVTVTVSAADQISWLCTDTLSAGLFGLGVKFLTFDAAGSKTFAFDFDASTVAPARKWYVASQGVRLDRFNKDILSLILDIIPTVTLIAGFGENPVPNATMQANFEFMRDYVEASPRMQPYSQPRTAGRTVADGLNESYIQSGDGLVVVRYDGLDPVIGWGEGYSAGHSVIAVRSPTNGTLYVCESTAHDAYWTRNGIQCHEYREWINLAVQAQYNVLLAPLSPENAAKFNSTAALEFWKETEGLNYGYLNFLFGWIDQKKDNFPCLPPTFDYCLGLGVVETIALAWDEFAADSPENVFRQALNHRLGTTNLSVEEVMMQGAQQGLSFPDIYTRPEQDSWRYNTIKYGQPTVGRAMVCCVFVCHMWKHGGIFDAIGDQINCAEQTLWDIFSMEIFDPAKLGSGRPQICTTTDPNNQLCQLIGTHTFQAKPDFNTRSLYPFMGQNCSSLSPNYVRAPGC